MQSSRNWKVAVCGVGCLMLALTARPAMAAPIPIPATSGLGGSLFYTGGDVTVTSLPVSSSFVSQLAIYDTTLSKLYLMDDEPSGVTRTFNPGSLGIAIGEELVFGIWVVDTRREYFMGPASRNPDGILHAIVTGPVVHPTLGEGFEVAFEDIFGGGDRDYDDTRFFFQGGVKPVPEPLTLSLFGVALGAATIARRRKA